MSIQINTLYRQKEVLNMRDKKLTIRLTEDELNLYKETGLFFGKSVSHLIRKEMKDVVWMYRSLKEMEDDKNDVELLKHLMDL